MAWVCFHTVLHPKPAGTAAALATRTSGMAFSGQINMNRPKKINRSGIQQRPGNKPETQPGCGAAAGKFRWSCNPSNRLIILRQTNRQGLDFFGTFFVKKKSTNKKWNANAIFTRKVANP
jgi:hypothetical protein